MAMPTPKKHPSNKNVHHLLNQIKNQINTWEKKANKMTDVETHRLKNTVLELENNCHHMNENWNRDFKNFKNYFNSKINNPKNVNTNDFKKMLSQLNQLNKDLNK